MKPYGVDPKHDDDCCPGHSRYSGDTYRNRRGKKAQTRDTKTAHRAERRTARAAAKAAAREKE